MSRVGNKLIELKDGVTVEVKEGNLVTVKGPKGEITQQLSPKMTITVEGNHVKVARPSDSIENKTLHGTTRALLHNMVEGVTNEFTKSLVIEGVGYKAVVEGKNLVVYAGYSHTVPMAIPEGLTVKCPSATEVVISGVNRQVVGQFAANVRAVREPEPYLGKGIRYKDEVIRRKEGKKAK
jgi:large subunit ribosomal protein L6